MNLRRRQPPDSLYLLLDTLCNAFGGIILLAVLVVLLTSKERSQSGTSSDSRELRQRRLALARTNLEQSLELAASLSQKANDDRWKKQVALLSTRKDLQSEIRQLRDNIAKDIKELDVANTADPSERLKALNAELAEAQLQKLQAQNILFATQENVKRLKDRLAVLRQQFAAKLNDLQRALRLPREHETAKRAVYVIAQYGHLYPCRNADLSRNETDIKWTDKAGREIADPIPGRGIDPAINPRGLETVFRNQSRENYYPVFLVFEDSFPAFIQARPTLVAAGFSYGWKPLTNGAPLVFSEFGSKPNPQ